MRSFALALTCLTALPVQAEVELHCLGLEPRFGMILYEDTARFDYLGDGTFALSPPLSAPLDDFTRVDLLSAGGPVPLFLERRPCPSLAGVALAYTLELGLPAFAGQVPASACCLDAAAR